MLVEVEELDDEDEVEVDVDDDEVEEADESEPDEPESELPAFVGESWEAEVSPVEEDSLPRLSLR